MKLKPNLDINLDESNIYLSLVRPLAMIFFEIDLINFPAFNFMQNGEFNNVLFITISPKLTKIIFF